MVLRDLLVQALRFGKVAFLRARRGRDHEREREKCSETPFVQPMPIPALH
jgi:hypothetical protein